MTILRKSAKGRDCTVRIPGVCNFDPETTVLAHLGGGGMGMKRNDIHAAFCCGSCHRQIDGAEKSIISKSMLKMYHLDWNHNDDSFGMMGDAARIGFEKGRVAELEKHDKALAAVNCVCKLSKQHQEELK